MSRTADAHAALTAAVQESPTECRDDPLFIADDLSKADCKVMAAICAD